MLGIGLQEMLVIFVVALVVVGPDKLPILARSLAKGLVEIRKTLEQAKGSLTQENEMLESVKRDLKEASDSMRDKMIESDSESWHQESKYPIKQEDGFVDMAKVQAAKSVSLAKVSPTKDEVRLSAVETPATDTPGAESKAEMPAPPNHD